MSVNFGEIKLGLALVMLGLAFGIGMGISFGVNEDMYKDRITEQVAAHPAVHDEDSVSKIWRYAQRAHFHATGIAAFSLDDGACRAGSRRFPGKMSRAGPDRDVFPG